MKPIHALALAALLAAGASHAQSGGTLQVKNEAFVQEETVDAKGKKTVKLVPPGKVVPGSEIVYVVTVKNVGAARAEQIKVDNPVPADTTYVVGSAVGDGSTATVSVDGGKTYGDLARLTVTEAGKSRPAKAEDVTHVRWLFASAIAPAQQASVSFRARIK